jgi:hypothetical protein
MENLFERKEEMKTLIFLLSVLLINFVFTFYMLDKRIRCLEEGYNKTVDALDMIIDGYEEHEERINDLERK